MSNSTNRLRYPGPRLQYNYTWLVSYMFRPYMGHHQGQTVTRDEWHSQNAARAYKKSIQLKFKIYKKCVKLVRTKLWRKTKFSIQTYTALSSIRRSKRIPVTIMLYIHEVNTLYSTAYFYVLMRCILWLHIQVSYTCPVTISLPDDGPCRPKHVGDYNDM